MYCPLCQQPDAEPYAEDDRRPYYRCPVCSLVFVPTSHHLDPDAEKRVYDQHQNHPDDPRYRAFLSRLYEPMIERLPENAEGLDFGCGPGPTLSIMFAEAGRPVRIYDPIYTPDPAALRRQYDFITATEVVEHLHRPGEELARLWSLLRPGGCLGLMTRRLPGAAAFENWHYKNDPTHVCFYAEATFRWISRGLGAKVAFPADDVVLLWKTGQKPGNE